jgi:hypothetical protein
MVFPSQAIWYCGRDAGLVEAHQMLPELVNERTQHGALARGCSLVAVHTHRMTLFRGRTMLQLSIPILVRPSVRPQTRRSYSPCGLLPAMVVRFIVRGNPASHKSGIVMVDAYAFIAHTGSCDLVRLSLSAAGGPSNFRLTAGYTDHQPKAPLRAVLFAGPMPFRHPSWLKALAANKGSVFATT